MPATARSYDVSMYTGVHTYRVFHFNQANRASPISAGWEILSLTGSAVPLERFSCTGRSILIMPVDHLWNESHAKSSAGICFLLYGPRIKWSSSFSSHLFLCHESFSTTELLRELFRRMLRGYLTAFNERYWIKVRIVRLELRNALPGEMKYS